MGQKKERRAAQEERDRAMDKQLYDDFYNSVKRKRRKRNVRIGFLICLAIMLVVSLLNWGVITNWGQVKIDRISLKGDDGGTYSALVYTPKTATDANKAPVLICYHGNSGSGRNHESWAMEFARRGFVVVSPDLMGAGDSQSTWDEFGMNGKAGKVDTPELFYKYVLAMPNVDTSNIIVSGHSMGAEPAQYLGAKYKAKAIMNASGMPKGIFNDSFQSTWDDTWKTYQGDYLYLVGNIETPEHGGNRDTQMIGMDALSHYPEYSSIETFETNKLYGSFDKGDAVEIQTEKRVHEAAFVSTETIGHLLSFGQQAIGSAVPNYIDPDNQVWMYKDYIGLVGIFAFVAFMCSLALLLIEEVPAFAYVRRPLARNVGFRGPGLVIATIVGLVVPWFSLKTDAFGIIGGKEYANLQAAGFMLGYNNMGFGIVLSLSIVTLVGIIIFILTKRKKAGLKLSDFGLTPYDYDEKQSGGAKALSVLSMALRTLLLAAIVVAVGWAYIQLQLAVLGTDFYSFFWGVKDIPIIKVKYYWNYLAMFILCFIILGIDMNVVRRLPSTGKENLDLIIGMVVNLVVGCAVIATVILLKWNLETNCNPLDSSFLLSIPIGFTRILGLPTGMAVATTGSTFIYKKTGNLWLVAFFIGTVACLLGLLYGQTRFHF